MKCTVFLCIMLLACNMLEIQCKTAYDILKEYNIRTSSGTQTATVWLKRVYVPGTAFGDINSDGIDDVVVVHSGCGQYDPTLVMVDVYYNRTVRPDIVCDAPATGDGMSYTVCVYLQDSEHIELLIHRVV